MFKFNFGFEEDVESNDSCPSQIEDKLPIPIVEHEPLPAPIQESKEFFPTKNALFKTSKVISDVTAYSDVIAGVYEGGMKKWECSDDLMSFLQETIIPEDDDDNIIEEATSSSSVSQPRIVGGVEIVPFSLDNMQGSRVIDLGCGHGYPGIFCLRKGASTAVFQDLNEDVLSSFTVPNVLAVTGMVPILRKPDQFTQTQDQSTTTEDNDDVDANSMKERIDKLRELSNTNSKVNNQSSGKTHTYDIAQYEHIKALILNGEDVDEELVAFVEEIEEEMKLEEEEKQQEQQHYKYVHLSQQYPGGYSAHSHAQFFSGPWAQQELSELLLSASPAAETCTAPSSMIMSDVTVAILSNECQTKALITFIQQQKKSVLPLIPQALNFGKQVIASDPNTTTTSTATCGAGNTFILLLQQGIVSSESKLDATVISKISNKITDPLDLELSEALAQLSIDKLITTTVDTMQQESITTPTPTPTGDCVGDVIGAMCVVLEGGSLNVRWCVVNNETQSDIEVNSHITTLLDSLNKCATNLAEDRRCNVISAFVKPANYGSYISSGFQELGWRKIPKQFRDSSDNSIIIRMGKCILSDDNGSICELSSSVKDIGTHGLMSAFRYDTIVSGDTLYSVDTMPVLIKCIRHILHKEGQALIAAKRYYFGVGGSTAAFQDLLKEYGDMTCDVAAVFQDGASNIREILLVKWK